MRKVCMGSRIHCCGVLPLPLCAILFDLHCFEVSSSVWFVTLASAISCCSENELLILLLFFLPLDSFWGGGAECWFYVTIRNAEAFHVKFLIIFLKCEDFDYCFWFMNVKTTICFLIHFYIFIPEFRGPVCQMKFR